MLIMRTKKIIESIHGCFRKEEEEEEEERKSGDVSPDSVHGQCALSAITARVSILPVLI